MSRPGIRNKCLQDEVCICVKLLVVLNNSREIWALGYFVKKLRGFIERTKVQSEILPNTL